MAVKVFEQDGGLRRGRSMEWVVLGVEVAIGMYINEEMEQIWHIHVGMRG